MLNVVDGPEEAEGRSHSRVCRGGLSDEQEDIVAVRLMVEVSLDGWRTRALHALGLPMKERARNRVVAVLGRG